MGADLIRGPLLALALAAGGPALAEAPHGPPPGAPLSAIDWLSESISPAAGPPLLDEPPATGGIATEDIAVSVLGASRADAAGLFSPAVTGLPRGLWGASSRDDLIRIITTARPEPLPALRELFRMLLLAELDPPADSDATGRMLLARIDKLLEMAAIEEAAALIEVAGSTVAGAEMFRRAFDVALLTGTEDDTCAEMRRSPGLAPTFPARIYCLARGGDWQAAALTLRTAQALGYVSGEEEELLARFLDPELYDGDNPLPPPHRPTPLIWRMYEAVGEPLGTHGLPLAFAHAELRPTSGWKAQLEAAERLARVGAIPSNRLLGLYTERRPAASGGVWDRAAALQAFDAALAAGDAGAAASALPPVWARMQEAELEVPFAELYAEPLAALDLPEAARALAFHIALLAPGYERAALDHAPRDAGERFLAALATGRTEGAAPPDSMARAIAPVFTGTPGAATGPALAAMLAEDRMGEAILTAIDRITEGTTGDRRGVTEGLALLRHIGLEDAARRTALQLLLLDRRG